MIDIEKSRARLAQLEQVLHRQQQLVDKAVASGLEELGHHSIGTNFIFASMDAFNCVYPENVQAVSLVTALNRGWGRSDIPYATVLRPLFAEAGKILGARVECQNENGDEVSALDAGVVFREQGRDGKMVVKLIL